MPQSGQRRSTTKLHTALSTLQALNVPFRGPFVTPSGQHIYVVDECLLAEEEIVKLYASGKFSAEHIAELLSDLRRNQRAES